MANHLKDISHLMKDTLLLLSDMNTMSLADVVAACATTFEKDNTCTITSELKGIYIIMLPSDLMFRLSKYIKICWMKILFKIHFRKYNENST